MVLLKLKLTDGNWVLMNLFHAKRCDYYNDLVVDGDAVGFDLEDDDIVHGGAVSRLFRLGLI